MPMDSQLSTFMTLSGFAAASLHLGDARPAWIWAADGKTVLWANPAGAAFFGVRSLAALGDLSGHERAPARPHIMRVAENGPTDRDTTDRLRFYRGLRVMLVTCSCRRIELPGGESGALIVALDARAPVTTSLSQALVDLVSGGHGARETSAIVFDRSGQVLASSARIGTPDFADVSHALRAAKHAPARATLPLESGNHASLLLTLDSGETLVLLDNEPQPLADVIDEAASPHTDLAEEALPEQAAVDANTTDASDDAATDEAPMSDQEKAPPRSAAPAARGRIASATGLFAFASATRFLERKEAAPAAEPEIAEEQETFAAETAPGSSPHTDADEDNSAEPTGSGADVVDRLSQSTLAAEEVLAEELLEEALPAETDTCVADATTAPEADGEEAAVASAKAPAHTDENALAEADTLPLVAETDDVEEEVLLATHDDPAGAEEAMVPNAPEAQNEASEPDAVDAGFSTTSAEDAFIFEPRDRAIRFAWKMDGERRFTFLSPEFEEALGPHAADIVGKSWDEIAERFEMDTDGRVAAALKRRDTWSGRTVLWPVSGHALRVPVDMAALPAFDRQRAFEGFRGFGVCRTGEAENDPDALGIRLAIETEPRQAGSDTAPDVDASDEETPDTAIAAETPESSTVDDPETATGATTVIAAATAAAVATAGLAADALDTSDEEAPEEDETPREADAADTSTEQDPATDAAAADGDNATADVAHGVMEPDGDEPDHVAETHSASEGTGSGEAPEASFDVPQSTEESGTAEAEADAAGGEADETGPDEAGSHEAGYPLVGQSPASSSHPGEEEPDDTATTEAETSPPREQDADRPGSALDIDEDLFAPAAGVTLPAAAMLSGASDEEATARDQETATPDDDVLDAEFEEVETDEEPGEPGDVAPNAEENPQDPAKAHDDGSVTSIDAALETSRLSKPERDAFRKIAEALGARSSEDDNTEAGTASGQTAPGKQERTGRGVVEPLGIIARPVEPAKRTPRTSLLDKLPVGVAIIADDAVIYANSTLLTLSGHPDLAALEAAGGLDALFAEPEDWPSSLPGSMTERTMRLRLADGGAKPVKARLHSVEWNDDTALMISLVDRHDPAQEAALDRLHEAQTALALSEEQVAEMDAVLETATDGVLILDENGAIVKVNRSAEALFNASRDEMNGAPLTNYLAPESHRDALDYLDGLARNGVASVLNDGREVIGQVGSGGLIPLFMTIGRVGHGTDGPRFCTVLRDITQWKKAEEELTDAKRQAESASSKKSDFLAKISHEIRTPLNAIIGFSEVMMEERFGPVGNDRYKGYLRDIHNSGSHIMSLINDLLDLSKIEAGKLDLTFEAVCANDIIRECVALMQPQANRERVIIRASLPTSVPKVVADGRSVRQIVLNLLSNAIKFNQPGGQVIVSTALEDSGEVILRVRDTGLGMSNQDLAAAMEPFRQLHTARHGGGTGLGLPLTKALVEANRASFRIDSELNHGTLIEITFPPQRVLAE